MSRLARADLSVMRWRAGEGEEGDAVGEEGERVDGPRRASRSQSLRSSASSSSSGTAWGAVEGSCRGADWEARHRFERADRRAGMERARKAWRWWEEVRRSD